MPEKQSQQELKCLLSLSDCKGEESDKLRVEIKRKVQEEKIINIRIFLYLHKLIYTGQLYCSWTFGSPAFAHTVCH